MDVEDINQHQLFFLCAPPHIRSGLSVLGWRRVDCGVKKEHKIV